jgi:hypothetical protein
MPTLGVFLAVSSHIERVLRYAKVAHQQNYAVKVFVTFEAVSILDSPFTEELLQYAEVIACAQTVQQQKVKVCPGVILGSQFDHAEIAHGADRFLSFT